MVILPIERLFYIIKYNSVANIIQFLKFWCITRT